MIKTSNKTYKTQPSQQVHDIFPVSSSCQNWRYNSRYDKPKNTHPTPAFCRSCGSQVGQFDQQPYTQATQPSQSVYLKGPFTPVSHKFIPIPSVSQVFTQYKQGSKLSLQLNQISLGFNKENKRIQQALFEIKQSAIKKQNSKFSKSLTMSKKSRSSKKTNKLKVDQNSIVKVLNYSNFAKVCRDQFRKDVAKNSAKKQTKLKKKNINQLIKEQRMMLRSLGCSLRNSTSH